MNQLRIFTSAGRLIASIVPRRLIDATVIEELGAELKTVVTMAQADRATLVVDFRRVVLLGSKAIGHLVFLNKICKSNEVRLKLWNVQPSVMEIFELTKLYKVFELTNESEDRTEDSWRFAPELFEHRKRVLAALEAANFQWWGDYGTVYPLHDLYGIEISGIRLLEDANVMLDLARDQIPEWKRTRIWVGYRWGADPNWIVRIHRDAGRPYETWDEDEGTSGFP